MRKIITDYVCPPIPTSRYDWCAWFEDDEPDSHGNMLVGWGATEEDAIEDLRECSES
jgi:hypothetical protein